MVCLEHNLKLSRNTHRQESSRKNFRQEGDLSLKGGQDLKYGKEKNGFSKAERKTWGRLSTGFGNSLEGKEGMV